MNRTEAPERAKEASSCVDELSGANGTGCWIRPFWKTRAAPAKRARERSDLAIANKLSATQIERREKTQNLLEPYELSTLLCHVDPRSPTGDTHSSMNV